MSRKTSRLLTVTTLGVLLLTGAVLLTQPAGAKDELTLRINDADGCQPPSSVWPRRLLDEERHGGARAGPGPGVRPPDRRCLPDRQHRARDRRSPTRNDAQTSRPSAFWIW